MFEGDDPLRPVGLVVAALTVAFAAVLVGVQLRGHAEDVLTLPLVVAVPVAAAGIYWYAKRR